MGNASPTQLAKLAIGVADPVDTALNYSDFDPGVSTELFDGNATKGTFDKDGNLIVPETTAVTPTFGSMPTSGELGSLLAWGMGGTVTGTTTKTYALGDVLAQRFVYQKPVNGDSWFLGGVAVDTMTISAQRGAGLSCRLECVGQSYVVGRTDFPVLALDQTTNPFVLAQLVLSVAGSARKTRRFDFTVRHFIDRERYLNSATLTDVVKQDQQLTLAVEIPSGDNPGSWNLGVSGAAVIATFTNAGGKIFTLTFPDVRFKPQSPRHERKAEGFQTLEGELYRVGSGRPATVTLTA